MEFIIDTLNEENWEEVYQFCERNVDHWSQPSAFFKLASLSDTQFNANLTIVAYAKLDITDDGEGRVKNGQIIGFFMGTTRIDPFIKKTDRFLKFFVVERNVRRQGIATNLLGLLYQRFLSLNLKGSITALTCPPDYWFSGMNPKFTPAYFWLQSVGFKKSRIFKYRQDLIVDFNNPNLPVDLSQQPPLEKGEYRYMIVSEPYLEKTYNFIAKHFHGFWKDEYRLSLRLEPPTTYIAVDTNSDEVVGFATYNAHFDGSFGPTGVRKDLRGKGIGGILFRWTLYALKTTGHDHCQILWVVKDTVKYYSKVAGAYISQVYFPMKGKIKIK